MNDTAAKIRRHGRTIVIGGGVTATEGMDGNLPTLMIRKNGKPVNFFRGSSLWFDNPLRDEDKEYLASLAKVRAL